MSAPAEEAQRVASPGILVAIPTTGGPLLLRRLAPRPGLPHPAAFADGDYRPLALSADYRALAGPAGPIARRLGAPPPPHELRLSGEPDGGRSWEAPVALAHLLLAGGGTLAAEPEAAGLLLWATGAIDLDLRLLPGDSALARKVEASRALLEGMGDRRAVAVLPPGPGRDEAARALAGLRRTVPIEVVPAEDLGAALTPMGGGPTRPSAPQRSQRKRVTFRWPATSVVAVVVWLLWSDRLDEPGPVLVAALGPASDAGDEEPVARPEPSDSAAPAADLPAPMTVNPTPPAPDPPAPEVTASVAEPALLIDTVRAAPGSSCRAALFNPALRVRAPAPREGAGFAALPLDPGLCGVAFRPAAADATLGPASAVPPDAFVAAPSGAAATDGAVVLFLRGPPRDVVYAVPVLPENGPPITVEHGLVAPDATTE